MKNDCDQGEGRWLFGPRRALRLVLGAMLWAACCLVLGVLVASANDYLGTPIPLMNATVFGLLFGSMLWTVLLDAWSTR